MEELKMEIEVQKDFLTVTHQYPDFILKMHSFICTCENPKITLTEHIDYKWLKSNSGEFENPLVEFVKFFLENHQATENKMMSEIVDEYNGLIGDEDLPKDSGRMIGLSSKDSTQATYQTRARGWNNFNSGAISGFICW